jgi:hypothetical protein
MVFILGSLHQALSLFFACIFHPEGARRKTFADFVSACPVARLRRIVVKSFFRLVRGRFFRESSSASFLEFHFDPGGLVIDIPVTGQAHVLAGRLGGQLGLQLLELSL